MCRYHTITNSSQSRTVEIYLADCTRGPRRLAKNAVLHSRTKHIDHIHYHFIRERVDAGDIELDYVPTNSQVADILTKPFGMRETQTLSH